MQWYGFKHPNINTTAISKNYRRRINLNARTLALDFRPVRSYKDFEASVYLSGDCRYTYLKNSFIPNILHIHLCYNTYYANFCFNLALVHFRHDPLSRSIYIWYIAPNNYFTLYWLAFNFVFNLVTQMFFHKLKFRGKGYYVYKNYRNVIAFQFGYAHRVKIYLHFVSVKFLSKTTVFLFGTNKWDIMKASHWFFDKRPINVFTGRGVRFTRQIIYRKAGKMSTYR